MESPLSRTLAPSTSGHAYMLLCNAHMRCSAMPTCAALQCPLALLSHDAGRISGSLPAATCTFLQLTCGESYPTAAVWARARSPSWETKWWYTGQAEPKTTR